MVSSPSLVTPFTPVKIDTPASLLGPVTGRDTKTLGTISVNSPQGLYGSMATWPMIWKAADAGLHSRYRQSLEAAATEAALASIGSLYSIFYQPAPAVSTVTRKISRISSATVRHRPPPFI